MKTARWKIAVMYFSVRAVASSQLAGFYEQTGFTGQNGIQAVARTTSC
ncbi:hypothetical protein [Sulfuriflexus sp.]|nr:hypothetical protein [Sulfuriflexus sp.]MDT8405290.1 hypothetical protein [Sulfuriflexus sp.]